jgi:preprotein translocase subunit SecG
MREIWVTYVYATIFFIISFLYPYIINPSDANDAERN